MHLPSFDTRSTNPDPEDYANLIRFDFKSNGSNGLSDGGSYNGQMTWRAYGSGSDLSGGYPIRLAYTSNGNLWRQMGTSATSWGSWAKFALEPSTGGFLPLAGGTMTGNITLPGEENNTFKIGFTGASATSGLSTVDQSGAGLYIGANSKLNNSGVVVYNNSALPSSGIYFDGWNGDDMEFYTGASGTPVKRLTISSAGSATFTGDVTATTFLGNSTTPGTS